MKRRFLIFATLGVAMAAFWFLAVDRSLFVERCPACGHMSYITQIRVFKIPIYERRWENPTLLEKVMTDLGIQCTHPKLTRFHKHRFWGLWICACPCFNGIDGINADLSWYDENISAKVRAMAAANPSLRDEFSERVLINHDWKYWKTFVDEVKVEEPKIPN